MPSATHDFIVFAIVCLLVLGSIAFIANLAFRGAKLPREEMETEPLMPRAPEIVASDPAISCFVRGVALSMTEHSAQWRAGDSAVSWRLYHHGAVSLLWQWHEVPGSRGSEMTHTWSIRTPRTELTEAEQALLNRAGTDLVCAKSMAEHKARRALDDAIRAPYETLGCPPTPRGSARFG